MDGFVKDDLYWEKLDWNYQLDMSWNGPDVLDEEAEGDEEA